MSFNLPSLRETKQATNDAFRAELPGTDVEAYPNNIAVIATVIAGAIYQLYVFLKDLKKQMFVETATWSMDLHAKERPIPGRKNGETTEQLKARIVQRDKSTPQGGNLDDYEAWALGCEGVTRAYVQRQKLTKDIVVVWPMMDDLREHGIPTLDDCEAIKLQIDNISPIWGETLVLPAVTQAVDIHITDLSPNTATAQTEIITELEAYFKHISQVSTVDKQYSIYLNNLNEVINGATLVSHYILTAPTETVSFELSKIPILGSVTFD